jgi:hypothetical protein
MEQSGSKIFSALGDGHTSLKRYFQNTFLDRDRQHCIDLITGATVEVTPATSKEETERRLLLQARVMEGNMAQYVVRAMRESAAASRALEPKAASDDEGEDDYLDEISLGDRGVALPESVLGSWALVREDRCAWASCGLC